MPYIYPYTISNNNFFIRLIDFQAPFHSCTHVFLSASTANKALGKIYVVDVFRQYVVSECRRGRNKSVLLTENSCSWQRGISYATHSHRMCRRHNSFSVVWWNNCLAMNKHLPSRGIPRAGDSWFHPWWIFLACPCEKEKWSYPLEHDRTNMTKNGHLKR